MKPISLLVALLAGVLSLASCRGNVPSETVTVTFSLRDDGPTRAGAEDAPGESEVRRWALLLFRDGQFVDYGLSSSPGPITRTLQTGPYTAFAVANYPEDSFRPEAFRVTEDLTDGTVDLMDNEADAPVMSGQVRIVLPDGGTSPEITVGRLVCKAGIRKISVDFTDPTLAAQTFVLKSVFLTNCCGVNRYGSDFSPEGLPESKSLWYNPLGPSGNAFLEVRGIETTISTSAPYCVPHYFLYYPNPTTPDRDTHAETWSPRCTRMVIEAQIANRTCYYPITLPAIPRNRTCFADEIIIRRAGSADPEQEIPDAVEIVFSASVKQWEQQYNDKDAY